MTTHRLTKDDCSAYIQKHLFAPQKPEFADPVSNGIGLIGLELETFPYAPDENKPFGVAPVGLYNGKHPLIKSLLKVARRYGGEARYASSSENNDEHHIHLIQYPGGDSFQFEPGGQVEISTAPCGSIEKLEEHMSFMKNTMHEVTEEFGILFGQSGTNPWFSTEEIGNQLQKPRYLALEKYLDSLSPYGKQMMLQTCAQHVNLDLGQDPTTATRRIILANLLVPYVTAIFANSSFIGGKPAGRPAYRGYIWQQLDQKRSGICSFEKIKNPFDQQQLINTYLEFVLRAPLIFIPELGNKVLPHHYTMGYWLDHPIEGISPSLHHFTYHLTLLFPEVRIKGYLEMRSVDAPPSEWEMIPTMFYTGLLYSEKHMEKALDLLLPFFEDIHHQNEEATFGLKSDTIFDTTKAVMQIAMDGFESLPEIFKTKKQVVQFNAFYEKYTSRRRTFADDTEHQFFNGKRLSLDD